MPGGVPVGTLAMGKAGAVNAALLAARILALGDAAIAQRLSDWMAQQTAAVGRLDPMMRPEVAAAARRSVIGILGGGQLGRMLALAAARIGLKCHIFAPEGDNPAFEVARLLHRSGI